MAAKALEAAAAQHTSLPGAKVAARIVADMAQQILDLDLDERLKRLDRQIRETFRAHPQAEVIESLPGIGPSSSSQPETCRPTETPAISPRRPDSCPCLATPAAGPATFTGPSATAGGCGACSTCPLRSAPSVMGPTATST